MIESISFCVFAQTGTRKALERCLQSIRRQGVPDYEIIAAATEPLGAADVTWLKIPATAVGDSHSFRSLVYNRMCGKAAKAYLVCLDAGVELAEDWYRHLRHCDMFDVIATRLQDSRGARIADWVYLRKLGGQMRVLYLQYTEWHPKAFVSGILMTLRRAVWERILFNERLGEGSREDADFCLRATGAGFRTGVCSDAFAICGRALSRETRQQGLAAGDVAGMMKRLRKFSATAFAAYHKQQYRRAAKYFRKALRIERDNCSFWTHLGWSLYQLRDWQAALPAFDAALKECPSDADAMRGKAWAHHALHQIENALRIFDALRTTLPAAADRHLAQDIYRGLAWCYLKAGDPEASLREFEHALQNISSEEKHFIRDVEKGVRLASRVREGHVFDLAEAGTFKRRVLARCKRAVCRLVGRKNPGSPQTIRKKERLPG